MDEKTLSLPSAAGMEKRIEELQRMATRANTCVGARVAATMPL